MQTLSKKPAGIPNCQICSRELSFLFEKHSTSDNQSYRIYSCRDCKFWQIDPLPSEEYLNSLYQSSYFQQRSDRGYDDYASEKIKQSVMATLHKNLTDLDFEKFSKNLSDEKTCLDIGCAAGYSVEYFALQDWQSYGIDVAEQMVVQAQKRGLNVASIAFLDPQLLAKLKLGDHFQFDLITLWATIEHLPQYDLFLEKMFRLLKPRGKVYLSTCHLGFWAKINGRSWRYLNVPEHLWYFSRRALKKIAAKHNLIIKKSFTYGSGFTTRANASVFYRWAKKIADFSAKFFHSGDMIVVELQKK